MWLVILSLLILFINGLALLFLLNNGRVNENLSYTELVLYCFSLGYAILTLITLIPVQFGFLRAPVNIIALFGLPVIAIIFWIFKKRKEIKIQTNALRNQINDNQDFWEDPKSLISKINLSVIVLIIISIIALYLRLETQLTTPWLGDHDPYYHLSFIDSIVTQGSLPSQTFWGFYSYPPSFHLVFATLISTIQVDRYLLLKIVPEFLGFLCVPAVYALIKGKYGPWSGIASATFLAVNSFHIYRTNLAIPEPIALLGILMFFHALVSLNLTKKYIIAGLFATIVFLTNIVAAFYFLPSVLAIFVVLIVMRKWDISKIILKSVLVGFILSAVFWLPMLFKLGFGGILDGLGPPIPYAAVFSFNSSTYFSWFGWGSCFFALIGLYVCFGKFKNNLVLLIPTLFFVFLIEAGNNGYHFFEPSVLFRGLLFLGTWVTLLAGVGFWRIAQKNRKIFALLTLLTITVLTVVSFPILSGNRYPVNWGNEYVDFVYQSYHNNYSDLFGNKPYFIYASDISFNYGAFSNVLLDKQLPQFKEALTKNDTSLSGRIIKEYNIKYLILQNGTKEAQFLIESNLVSIYYNNWHTIVLAVI